MKYSQVLNGMSLSAQDRQQLRDTFAAIEADIAAVTAGLVVALAQLDLDGGVTGTTFEANGTPAAATFTE